MSSNKKPNNNSCFTTIFKSFICIGNLPTHPSSSSSSSSYQIFEKLGKIHPYTHPTNSNLNEKCQEVHQVTSLGVIPKLMGLDSLPKYATTTTTTITTTTTNNNNDILFRSKSLNSLHFFPDFNSTRIIGSHRRVRTSTSFHEQGHKFLGKIDENLQIDHQMKEFDEVGFGCRKNHSKKNEFVLKGVKQEKIGRIKDNGSKLRYDQCYYNTTRSNSSSKLKNGVISDEKNNKCGISKKKLVLVNKEKINRENVGSKLLTSTSKKKVVHDLILSPSHHHKEFLPHYYSKGERRQLASNSRRKSTPKIKICDNFTQERMPKSKRKNHKCSNRIATKHKLVKEEVETANDFVEMLGKIGKLVEEQIKDSKWVTNYEVLKMQFVSALCINFSQELLDLLLDELVNENFMLV